MKIIFAAAMSIVLAACAATQPLSPLASTVVADDPDTIKVMVLGTYHMNPSGADIANAEVDSVLTPARQRELEVLADALMSFRPTVVAVERETDAPGYVDDQYSEFSDATLSENPNERAQIGYRLARLAGLDVVYGIDEQPSNGEPDYFPFDKLLEGATAAGKGDALDAQIADARAMAADFSAQQATQTIPELLLDGRLSDARFYYETFQYDSGEAQPGAELQAYWFMRNAKIFSKLLQIAEPGDRVVVLYGAGHQHWLEHFARETPGVELVDARPYLESAAEDLR